MNPSTSSFRNLSSLPIRTTGRRGFFRVAWLCTQSTDTSSHSATSFGVRSLCTDFIVVVRIPAYDQHSAGSSVSLLVSLRRTRRGSDSGSGGPPLLHARYALPPCLFVRHSGCLIQKSIGASRMDLTSVRLRTVGGPQFKHTCSKFGRIRGLAFVPPKGGCGDSSRSDDFQRILLVRIESGARIGKVVGYGHYDSNCWAA